MKNHVMTFLFVFILVAISIQSQSKDAGVSILKYSFNVSHQGFASQDKADAGCLPAIHVPNKARQDTLTNKDMKIDADKSIDSSQAALQCNQTVSAMPDAPLSQRPPKLPSLPSLPPPPTTGKNIDKNLWLTPESEKPHIKSDIYTLVTDFRAVDDLLPESKVAPSYFVQDKNIFLERKAIEADLHFYGDQYIRTEDENGHVIYKWYDRNGSLLYVLSEFEYTRRRSMLFQNFVESLYPEIFEPFIPLLGGYHCINYFMKKVTRKNTRDYVRTVNVPGVIYTPTSSPDDPESDARKVMQVTDGLVVMDGEGMSMDVSDRCTTSGGILLSIGDDEEPQYGKKRRLNDNEIVSLASQLEVFAVYDKASKEIPNGYVTGYKPPVSADGPLYFHTSTKSDLKQKGGKGGLLSMLLPYLKEKTGFSQTKVLEAIIRATEIIPYIRKIKPELIEQATSDPSQLQGAFFNMLLERIQQLLAILEMRRISDIPDINVQIILDQNDTNKGRVIIGSQSFSSEQIGVAGFRQIRDCVSCGKEAEIRDQLMVTQYCKEQDQKKVCKRLDVLSVKARYSIKFMVHHLAKISEFQSENIKKTMEALLVQISALQEVEYPCSEKEYFQNLETMKKLILNTEPAFIVMKPLCEFLKKQKTLKIETKISSKHLAWINRAAMGMLYTHLLPYDDEDYEQLSEDDIRILSVNPEADSQLNTEIKTALIEIDAKALDEIIKTFDAVICDLTSDTDIKTKRGMIYTLIKSRHLDHINDLLGLKDKKSQFLSLMYTQIIALMHTEPEPDSENEKAKREIRERDVDFLLRRFTVRMALCIQLAKKEVAINIEQDVINKALAVIEHHNHLINSAFPDEGNTSVDDNMDHDGMSFIQSRVSVDTKKSYLDYPDDAFIKTPAVRCNPETLLQPVGKHFIVFESDFNEGDIRRSDRQERDSVKLWSDAITHSLCDLKNPVCWERLEVPAAYLFEDQSSSNPKLVEIQRQLVSTLEKIRNEHGEDAVNASDAMNVSKELFRLAEAIRHRKRSVEKKQTDLLQSNPNLYIKHFVSKVISVLDAEKSINDREKARIVEYAGCLILYRVDFEGLSLSRILKFLYITTSRATELDVGIGCERQDEKLKDNRQFGSFGDHGNSDSKKLKVGLNGLINRNLSNPDGMQGRKIRRFIKRAVFSQESPASFKKALLDFIRPVNRDEPGYEALILKVINDLDASLNDSIKLSELNKKLAILDGQNKRQYKENISQKLNKFILDVSELMGNITNNTADAVMNDSVTSSQTDLEPSQQYLISQIKSLALEAGMWLSEFSNLPENDFLDLNNIDGFLKKVHFFLAEDSPSVFSRLSEQYSLAEIRKVNKLFKDYHALTLDLSNYALYNPINECHGNLEEAKKAYLQLKVIGGDGGDLLPTVGELNERIKAYTETNDQSLSQEELIKLNKASYCRRYIHYNNISILLNRRSVKDLSQDPQVLSSRITEQKQKYPEDIIAKYKKYQSLQCTAHYLSSDPVIVNYESEKANKIAAITSSHKERVAFLKGEESKYKNHLLMKNPQSDSESLMLLARDFDVRQQPREAAFDQSKDLSENISLLLPWLKNENTVHFESSGDSLLTVIGVKNTKSKSQKGEKHTNNNVQKEGVYDNKRPDFKKLSHYSTARIKERECKIVKAGEENDHLFSNHEIEKDELEKNRNSIRNLLGERVNGQVTVDGETYAYLDAFFALDYAQYYSRQKHADLTAMQRNLATELQYLNCTKRKKKKDMSEDQRWVAIVDRCAREGIDPDRLPEIKELFALIDMPSSESIPVLLSEQKNIVNRLEENLKIEKIKLEEESRIFSESLKEEMNTQQRKTDKAQFELFTRAFEQGQDLDLGCMTVHLLCKYIRDKKEVEAVKRHIIADREDMKKHVPDSAHESIRCPSGYINKYPLLNGNIVPCVVSVKGAYPLLLELYKEGVINPYCFLCRDSAGTYSALILAAANGRYNACKTLLDIISENPNFEPSYFIKLLTDSPMTDGRNLLHHLAMRVDKKNIDLLLGIINTISAQQGYDPDYPEDDIKNKIGKNSGYILEQLLQQTDSEGMRPGDILFYKIGEKIKKWGDDETNISGFFHEFMMNDCKAMWRIAANCLEPDQLFTMFENFFKGCGDWDQLSENRKQTIEYFMREFARILKAHTPDAYEALINTASTKIP